MNAKISCPHCSKPITIPITTALIEAVGKQYKCPECKGPISTTGPQEGPQSEFLQTDGVHIVGFGGQAGGGKSHGLLLHPLRYVDNPRFDGIIFRRTRPQITQLGGLWEESLALYRGLGSFTNKQELNHRFPSGAQVRFGYMETAGERFKFDGSQYTFVGFDQAEHFESECIFYLFSRMRSTSGITPHLRLTFNPPDPRKPEVGFWLHDLFAPWIDEEFPDPAQPGEVRYFIRPEDTITWCPPDTRFARSVTFIPAALEDNKVLMIKDPNYLAMLEALPYEDRQRLRHGSWKILSVGKMFKRPWFGIVDAVPRMDKIVRIWDNAATESAGAFTVGLKVGIADDVYYVLDMIAEQFGTTDREKLQRQTAMMDGPIVEVGQEREGGSSGKDVSVHAGATLFKGFTFHSLPASKYGDKVLRAKPAASAAENKRIKILKGPWNEMFLGHVCLFPHGKYKDFADCLAWAILHLGGSLPRAEFDGKRQPQVAQRISAPHVNMVLEQRAVERRANLFKRR